MITKKHARAGTGCFSATECLEESIEEKAKEHMNWEYQEQFLDVGREDIDSDVFAVALAVRHVRRLLGFGGRAFARPDDEPALRCTVLLMYPRSTPIRRTGRCNTGLMIGHLLAWRQHLLEDYEEAITLTEGRS